MGHLKGGVLLSQNFREEFLGPREIDGVILEERDLHNKDLW